MPHTKFGCVLFCIALSIESTNVGNKDRELLQGRPTLEDLRQDLRAVTRKWADWDIATPEMETAWQQGRKELF
jgi:hypothetical protein